MKTMLLFFGMATLSHSAVIYTTWNYTTASNVSVVTFTPKPKSAGASPQFQLHLGPTPYLMVVQTQNQFTGRIYTSTDNGYIMRLPEGTSIGGTSPAWKQSCKFGIQWNPGEEGYVGMSINDTLSSNVNFAWYHMKWNLDKSFTFINSGYETITFKSIEAVHLPEVSSLLLLLFGVGFSMFRRNH